MGTLSDLIDELNEENKKLKEKVEKLSEQIEALKKEAKKTPKKEIWQPQIDETYWWINEYGEVEFSTYKDKDVERIGNCYPTEEKAQFEAQREKYTRLFRQYVEQHSKPINWKDNTWFKWWAYYDWHTEKIMYNNACRTQGMSVYGSSEEVMQDAVEFVGEDNFLKYVLGVKND